jgi:hypothetical protein
MRTKKRGGGIMAELLLKGYLRTDYDGHPGLDFRKNSPTSATVASIPNEIQGRLNYEMLDRGLGEKLTVIPNCSLSIWYTEDECSFEEAQEALLNKLDGCLTVHTAFLGYSEYTITGLALDEFSIGGHDLERELKDHMGEYCWIRLVV